MKNLQRLKKNINKIIFLLVPFFFISGLLIGLHLHGTFSLWIYEGKLKTDTFSCFGHDNLWETYQWDCYFPKPKEQSSFKMSNHLTCREIQSSGLNEDNFSDNTKRYLSTISFKTDSITYTIDIDSSSKKLYRSNTGGEVAQGAFTIIEDNGDMIIALRKAPLGEPFYSNDYEQIQIFKKSGKGVITGYHTPDKLGNAENIRMSYILCQ